MRRSSPSRSAPAVRPARPPRRGAGGTLVGVFIGLVLGIVIAAGVALYVTGGWKAYQQQVAVGRDARVSEPAKTTKTEGDKPRFDFYKILPGGEEPKVAPAKPVPPDRSLADQAVGRSAARAPDAIAQPPRTADKPPAEPPKATAADRFWLQAGSFTSEADAENLRARLALAGWEAQLQQGTLPDKGIRYRVRLGPYDNPDELNRIKGELARRGFDVAVIRY
jgi:cell division protein FtsN